MFFLVLIAILLTIVLAYVLAGRAWLKERAWAQPFFALVEPFEIALYKKSETLLAGRLLSAAGFILSFYDAVAMLLPQLDMTPITARLLAGVPPDMHGFVMSVAALAVGLLISWLRKRTSTPLEIVALPDDLPAEVATKVARAEARKDEAVAAVQDAKAEGAL